MEHAGPGIILLTLLFVGPVLYFISRAKKKPESIYIRRIPGIDAINEAVGRAVELGRPISFITGLSSIGPLLYACLGTLKYVARRVARFGSRLVIPSIYPDVMALTDAVIQNAYRLEKRSANYDPTCLRYLSDEQFAFASGYIGLIHREKVAAAFLFGSYAAESLILAEAGQQIGAIQVAATTSNEQIPFFITSCDYTLIGEELYAAGAFLSLDPIQRGSLRGQDWAKLFIVLLIVLGIAQATILSFIGSDAALKLPLTDWLNADWPSFLRLFPEVW